jgi:hypothetical protein
VRSATRPSPRRIAQRDAATSEQRSLGSEGTVGPA